MLLYLLKGQLAIPYLFFLMHIHKLDNYSYNNYNSTMNENDNNSNEEKVLTQKKERTGQLT